MLDKFEIIMSQKPTDDETLRAKRQLPSELEDLADRDLKRIVLDPEKSEDTIQKLIMLGVESDDEEVRTESRATTRRVGPSQPIHLGPEVGVEPCVRITIGFIFPCGTVRIGGCS